MTDLRVCEVTHRYGDRLALDDVTFTVPAGTVTGLLGANGSGKSTLIQRALGLTSGPGEVLFDGVPYGRLADPLGTVGAVLDSSGQLPGMRARDHVRAVAAAARVPEERVQAALAAVKLDGLGDRRIKALSLGMRQRLALAAALVADPAVLVLDEPTNGLDPHGVHWLGTFLRSFAGRGGTVLMSSHLIAEVEQIADQVVIISNGRVMASGSVSDITALSGSVAVVVTSDGPAVLARRLETAGASVETLPGERLRVTGMSAEEVARTAASIPVLVRELSTVPVSLESAFLQIASE